MSIATLRQSTQSRQAEIVAAALQLASERSPALISTTDMAQAIGLSQGALFKHFSSKEAIWLAAMAWVQQHLLQKLEAAAAQAATPLQGLQAVFEAHVAFVLAQPGVPRIVFHELQQPAESPLKDSVRGLMKSYRLIVLGLLKRAMQAGEVDDSLDAPAAATLFLGTMQGLVMQSMLSGHASTLRAEAPRVFDLYLRSLRPCP